MTDLKKGDVITVAADGTPLVNGERTGTVVADKIVEYEYVIVSGSKEMIPPVLKVPNGGINGVWLFTPPPEFWDVTQKQVLAGKMELPEDDPRVEEAYAALKDGRLKLAG